MNRIEQVLKEVTEQRELLESRLSNLKAAEENLMAFLQRAKQPELPLATPFAQRGLNPYKVVVTRKKGPKQAKRKGLDPRTVKVLEKARRLPATFTREDMKRVMGTGIEGCLHRWQVKGWVKRIGNGHYRMMETFPEVPGNGAAGGDEAVPTPGPSPSARVRIPGLDEDRASLEEKLQQALKERDEAVRSGRETMAKILQDKVNKLQDQLGET